MYYIPSKGLCKNDMKVLSQYMSDIMTDRSPEACRAYEASLMTPEQAEAMNTQLQSHPAVALTSDHQCTHGVSIRLD